MTIEEIIQGCWLGGCSLEQRLATIDGSSLPYLEDEAKTIKAHLARPQAERDAIFLKAVRKTN